MRIPPKPRFVQRLLVVSLVVFSGSSSVASDSASETAYSPTRGTDVVISHTEAMADSITVYPNGRGLPNGQGDATQGKALYTQHCAACHGSTGKNALNDALVGGKGTLTTPQPVRTVGSFWPYATTLFDYIQRAMPYNNPGSLEFDELYSITAYVLFLNEIIEENAQLDKSSLPLVQMPNQQGFQWLDWSAPDT